MLIVVSTFAFALLAYVRASVACVFRADDVGGERRLLWCGAATQTGAFIGATVMFVCVNVYKGVFVGANAC